METQVLWPWPCSSRVVLLTGDVSKDQNDCSKFPQRLGVQRGEGPWMGEIYGRFLAMLGLCSTGIGAARSPFSTAAANSI